MRKTTICIGENKAADQLRGNREADQRLCFRYTASTIPLLSKSKISSLLPSSVTVQAGLCRTWSEPKLLVSSRTGSNCLSREPVVENDKRRKLDPTLQKVVFLCFSGRCNVNMCNLNVTVVTEFISRYLYQLFAAILFSSIPNFNFLPTH